MVTAVLETPHTDWSVEVVPSQPGRQRELPSYRTSDGTLVHCLAGGFGWRYVADADGVVRLAGRLPVLRTTDAIVRDLPANQLMLPECVVSVRRRLD